MKISKVTNDARRKALREIMQREQINQVVLSRRTFIPQQSISDMLKEGGRTITDTTCWAIHLAFPRYSYEWIMGYSQYPTESERPDDTLDDIIAEHNRELEWPEKALILLCRSNGWRIAHVSGGFEFTRENGRSFQLDIDGFEELRDDFRQYAAAKLLYLLEKKGD